MDIVLELKQKYKLSVGSVTEKYSDELYLEVQLQDFKKTVFSLHALLESPVAVLFAEDRRASTGTYRILCAFHAVRQRKWIFVVAQICAQAPHFESLSREMYSANLFERELWEMFGIEAKGSPDARRLRLHDEVWPRDFFPLRKDFEAPSLQLPKTVFTFNKVEGEGVFEVPVGPVHAGIIGPGHFRFSVAGEPIIDLEIRLGFAHRGVEKLFESSSVETAVALSERVVGDSAFAHSLAFTHAVEKIYALVVPERARILRAIFLELERIYNHANDIGGIAIDVGFSYPAAFASLMKEAVLQVNETLTGSRYLKGFNTVGGLLGDIDDARVALLKKNVSLLKKDLIELKKMLYGSVSFMDRVDGTGIVKKKTALDFGAVGIVARATGITHDLRSDFDGVYRKVRFNVARRDGGDVLARLEVRMEEFQESLALINRFLDILSPGAIRVEKSVVNHGCALGYVESWRGPLLYWLNVAENGRIERCKIVDPSFHNWQSLAYCVLGDIIPDFPVCNKSFDLSYAGNDL